MEPSDLRSTIRALADDFGWLEGHCRAHPEQAVHATYLRLAAALVRNVVGPTIEKIKAPPLHIAVIGGAGAGKSTIANFLVGQAIAEANPQAGYTRHPIAFVPEHHLAAWPATDGFLGPLVRYEGTAPSSKDEDIYQRRTVAVPNDDPLAEFVVWDCPDMTTWAAGGYASRLTEVAALADVIVYVASDERYNDEVPTQYLHLLIKAGKAVVVCLTKMKESDAAGLTEHFRTEVLGKLPSLPDGSAPNIPVVCIPNLSVAERADPKMSGGKYRIALANHLLALCPNAEAARKRTVTNAVHFLETASAGLLDVAKADLVHVNAWYASVAAGRQAFEDRYRREFLSGETFRRFDKTRDDILDQLELPGKAKAVSTIIGFARWPYIKARDFLVTLVGRPPALALSEQDVLKNAMAGWLDGLQAESIRNAAIHPVWKQAASAFGTGAKQTATDRFAASLREFETKEIMELESVGKGITDRFVKNPGLVNVLRGLKIAVELVAVLAVIWYTWPPSWWIILVIPLALYFVHQITEWIVRAVVETARAKVRGQRMGLLASHLSTPLNDWLAALPISQNTSLERLQQVLARVPKEIRDVASAARSGAAA